MDKEAEVTKALQGQTVELKETEKKATESITSIQDIAAAQIASLNKELVEMQVRSRQFSQKYEGAENERIWFFYELHKYQMDSTHEREQRQAKCIKELEEARTQFSQQIHRVTEEVAARLKLLNISSELLTTKLRLHIEKAKHETLAIQIMNNTWEECINSLVMKQR